MKEKIIKLLNDNIEVLTAEEISDLLEIPPKPELGDFAFPCFRLAKSMRKAPQMIASEIAASLGKHPDFLQEIKTEGAYINFFLNKEALVKGIVENAIKEDYGSDTEGEGKTGSAAGTQAGSSGKAYQ